MNTRQHGLSPFPAWCYPALRSWMFLIPSSYFLFCSRWCPSLLLRSFARQIDNGIFCVSVSRKLLSFHLKSDHQNVFHVIIVEKTLPLHASLPPRSLPAADDDDDDEQFLPFSRRKKEGKPAHFYSNKNIHTILANGRKTGVRKHFAWTCLWSEMFLFNRTVLFLGTAERDTPEEKLSIHRDDGCWLLFCCCFCPGWCSSERKWGKRFYFSCDACCGWEWGVGT